MQKIAQVYGYIKVLIMSVMALIYRVCFSLQVLHLRIFIKSSIR